MTRLLRYLRTAKYNPQHHAPLFRTCLNNAPVLHR